MAPVTTAEMRRSAATCPSPRLNSQAERDDEEGLQKFGRLELADADLDPALGAIDLGPDHGDEDQQHEEERRAEQATAPRALAGHHRNADHHRQSDRDPRQLAPEIIELGKWCIDPPE